MKTDSPSHIALNERRRLAVKLRLEGRKLKEISQLVELSSPTIIAAHKQFLQGGWEAVDVKPRGRPTGERGTPGEVLETLGNLAFGQPEKQLPWSFSLLAETAGRIGADTSTRTIGNYVEQWGLSSGNLYKTAKTNAALANWFNTDYKKITATARKQDAPVYWAGLATCTQTTGTPGADKQVKKYFYAHTTKGQYLWLAGDYTSDTDHFIDFFTRLAHQKTPNQKTGLTVIWHGHDPALTPATKEWLNQNPGINFYQHPSTNKNGTPDTTMSTTGTTMRTIDENSADTSSHKEAVSVDTSPTLNTEQIKNSMTLTHLQRLEAESIHIMREAVAAAEKPAMLYSLGKDSSVMLHLAKKAFYPAKPPFPLVHIDTGWKFQAMYDFRDKVAKESGLQLIVHKNIAGIDKGVYRLRVELAL